jgi:hypothetical protein
MPFVAVGGVRHKPIAYRGQCAEKRFWIGCIFCGKPVLVFPENAPKTAG